MRSRFRSPAALLSALAVLAACNAQGGTAPSLSSDDNPDATLFLALDTHPGGYMDALYTGPVVRDAQGCLRVATDGEDASIVWPVGYTLEGRGGALFVRAPDGRVVGQVGRGTFRMGGGFVPDISYADGLSDDKKSLAASKCPGAYWLAGP